MRRLLLRLELLCVVRKDRVFRTIGAAVARRPALSEAARRCADVVAGLDESDELLLAVGEAERGDLSMETGEETGEESMRVREGRMSSGVRGVEGVPWTWSQQSSHTREGVIGEMGDANEVNGTLRGGWRKERLEASRRGVSREVQALQKTPPHLRQC